MGPAVMETAHGPDISLIVQQDDSNCFTNTSEQLYGAVIGIILHEKISHRDDLSKIPNSKMTELGFKPRLPDS